MKWLQAWWRWSTGPVPLLWRPVIGLGGPILLVLIIIGATTSSEDEPGLKRAAPTAPAPVATLTASDAAPTAAAPASTPTVEESLLEFVLCDNLRVTGNTLWGQSPEAINSGDPRITGRLEEGDYIQLLMSSPVDGNLRVKVYPHDYRVVGKTDDQVWIDWQWTLVPHRLDRLAFTCEDKLP